MKIQQQDDALNKFREWLKTTPEFSEKQTQLEIWDILSFDKYEYAIIKFRSQNGIMFGLCGGYLPNDINFFGGIIWSNFENCQDDISSIRKLCTDFLINQKSNPNNEFESILNKLTDLAQQKNWNEIIETVDKNIDRFIQPKEIDGIKCYQFKNLFQMHYYNTNNKEQYNWVDITELILLEKKLFALIEINRFDEAKALLDYLFKLNPNSPNLYFEDLEIAKRKHDLALMEEILNKAYNYIWYYEDFARLIRNYAWIAIEKGNIKHGIYCLALSLQYDYTDNCYNYVNNELEYIQQRFNLDEIPRPSGKEIEEYFVNVPYACPSDINRKFCMNIYGYILSRKSQYSEENYNKYCSYLKNNLIHIYRGLTVFAQMVEVEELTQNHFVLNNENYFSFEIPKNYTFKEIDKKNHPNRLYEIDTQQNDIITIIKCGKCTNDQSYINLIEKYQKEHEDAGFKIKQEDSKVINDSLKVVHVSEIGKTGKEFTVFWFKMTPSLIGRISATVTNNKSIENDIINILSSWQYL